MIVRLTYNLNHIILSKLTHIYLDPLQSSMWIRGCNRVCSKSAPGKKLITFKPVIEKMYRYKLNFIIYTTISFERFTSPLNPKWFASLCFVTKTFSQMFIKNANHSVERSVRIREVKGSSPSRSTIPRVPNTKNSSPPYRRAAVSFTVKNPFLHCNVWWSIQKD